MNAEEVAAAASRLCTACGLCCDGSLFQIVRMQPGDAPTVLMKLGMRIRCKDGEFLMEQPCAALRGKCCSIYEQRPERCRKFACQQLMRLEQTAITEGDALVMIASTRVLVDRVRWLIAQSGYREDGQPLQEQYDRVTAMRVDLSLEPELVVVREELEAAMRELKLRLAREFLPPPGMRRE